MPTRSSANSPPLPKLDKRRFTLYNMEYQNDKVIAYGALEPLLPRRVVIKEFFPAGCIRTASGEIDPGPTYAGPAWKDAVAEFLQVGIALRRINHSGIQRTLDVLEANNTVYLVQEPLEGHTLRQVVTRPGHVVDESAVLRHLRLLADALAQLHDQNLLYLHLADSTVFMREDDTPLLSQCELACKTGTFAGALAIPDVKSFAAPEVVRASARRRAAASRSRVGVAADVYSMGAIGDYMLKKQLSGLDPLMVICQNPSLKAEIARALNTSPDDRAPSVREFGSRLYPWIQPPPSCTLDALKDERQYRLKGKNLLPGSELRSPGGVYLINMPIGAGYNGITYKAQRHSQAGRTPEVVAIKELFLTTNDRIPEQSYNILLPDSMKPIHWRHLIQRTMIISNKIKALKENNERIRTNHDNIVSILDVFEANNTVYTVMEFLDGYDLEIFARVHGYEHENNTDRYKRYDELAIKYIQELCQGVRLLHRAQVLHLDIKPTNVMVTGMLTRNERVVLIDFGVALDFRQEQGVLIFNNHTPNQPLIPQLPTMSTAAPEVRDTKFDESRKYLVGLHSDVYSLAATAYYLFTRGWHYNPADPKRWKRLETFPQHGKIVPTLQKALQGNAEDRTASVDDFLAGLSEVK